MCLTIRKSIKIILALEENVKKIHYAHSNSTQTNPIN